MIINYSFNFSLPKRDKRAIKFIIIHYTGMKNESRAIKRLCDVKSKVSAHYFIKNNGDVINLVPDAYEAWHAGKSNWKKYTSLNKYSLGIEINNPGHKYRYKNFNLKQIKSLTRLLKNLISFYNINPKNILGHSDIAPNRKKDPGEKFPWKYLSKFKIGKWHSLLQKTLLKNRGKKITSIDKKNFFTNLSKIGYSSKNSKRIKKDKFLNFIISAFQRRFRQELINGKIDQECLLISQNLAKKLN